MGNHDANNKDDFACGSNTHPHSKYFPKLRGV